MPSLPQLVFATRNPNKIIEIKAKLGDAYTFLSLDDIGCTEELPETTGTIPGNALQKAKYVFEKYGHACFAEDSGLEIDALNGRPGVDTAHYAGSRDAVANMDKVLGELSGQPKRTARFRAVIALVTGSIEETFAGKVEGQIADTKLGTGGFGYDPIFIPEGYTETFAQLPQALKKDISHRSRAVQKLVDYLKH